MSVLVAVVTGAVALSVPVLKVSWLGGIDGILALGPGSARWLGHAGVNGGE